MMAKGAWATFWKEAIVTTLMALSWHSQEQAEVVGYRAENKTGYFTNISLEASR
jgi:hypothetical protein